MTPEIQFGDGTAETGTEMNLDFFSTTGFGNFNITSYKTEFIANNFDNGLGGYNAVLATQTLTIGAGETLNLTQSMFSPVLDPDQANALVNLGTGGDLYSVLTPGVPANAWDARAVNLTLGGLVELDVAQGGTIAGAAGSSLTLASCSTRARSASPAGRSRSPRHCPRFTPKRNSLAINDLSDAFIIQSDGTIDENAANKFGIVGADGMCSPRASLPRSTPFISSANSAQRTASFSLLAASPISPARASSTRAPPARSKFRDGRMVDGGTLQTVPGLNTGTKCSARRSASPSITARKIQRASSFPGDADRRAGLGDRYIRGVRHVRSARTGSHYVPTQEWSNGGTLAIANGGTLTDATIKAEGGA